MSETITAINPRTRQVMEVHPSMLRLGLVAIIRDTSNVDRVREQLALYAPCECGSGVKYKWCCKKIS
jgi:hypothetical protein